LALKQETLRHLAKTIAKDHTKLSPEETRSIGLVLCSMENINKQEIACCHENKEHIFFGFSQVTGQLKSCKMIIYHQNEISDR
jgi:hypothetical protein